MPFFVSCYFFLCSFFIYVLETLFSPCSMPISSCGWFYLMSSFFSLTIHSSLNFPTKRSSNFLIWFCLAMITWSKSMFFVFSVTSSVSSSPVSSCHLFLLSGNVPPLLLVVFLPDKPFLLDFFGFSYVD